MQEGRQVLTAWLNDAYAMENGQVRLLEQQIGSAADYPDIREGLSRHLEATRRHAEEVRLCLQSLGESPSTVKGALGAVMGFVEGLGSKVADDELVKAALGDYAMEHLEIAAYRTLSETARRLGEPEIARRCDDILRDEEAMAGWLEQRLPQVTELYLSKRLA